MTKLDLQKELLEKIKPGTKPSDLKKKSTPRPGSPQDEGYSSEEELSKENPVKKPVFTSPMEISKSDEGYSSSEERQSLVGDQIPKAPPLPNEQIKEQYKETISKLEGENKELIKTIADLQNTVKNPIETKQEPIKTFLCSDCHQERPQDQLSRVFGSFSFCLDCSKKARLQASKEKQPNPQPQEFICHSCQQNKQEIPAKMKLDETLQTYLICSTCRPNLKEFNEADLITDDLWAKYPYSSASEILEKEFGIKKEEVW